MLSALSHTTVAFYMEHALLQICTCGTRDFQVAAGREHNSYDAIVFTGRMRRGGNYHRARHIWRTLWCADQRLRATAQRCRQSGKAPPWRSTRPVTRCKGLVRRFLWCLWGANLLDSFPVAGPCSVVIMDGSPWLLTDWLQCGDLSLGEVLSFPVKPEKTLGREPCCRLLTSMPRGAVVVRVAPCSQPPGDPIPLPELRATAP